MYAAVIESEPVRRRSRLLPGSPAGLSSATVCPVIEEPYTCEVRGGRLQWCPIMAMPCLVCGKVAASMALTLCKHQPRSFHRAFGHVYNYETCAALQDLSRLEHRLLTRPTAVLEIDFLKDGAVLMGCAPSTPRSSHPHRPPVRLPVIGPGRADAVAVWFDLWLDGERGEHDIVSTRPEQRTKGDASGWVRLYFD